MAHALHITPKCLDSNCSLTKHTESRSSVKAPVTAMAHRCSSRRGLKLLVLTTAVLTAWPSGAAAARDLAMTGAHAAASFATHACMLTACLDLQHTTPMQPPRPCMRRCTPQTLAAAGRRQLFGSGFYDVVRCAWMPTAATSKADSEGRLWGWENGRSCAFRFGSDRPVFYTGYEPGSWVTVAPCRSDPFAPDSVTVRPAACGCMQSKTPCSKRDLFLPLCRPNLHLPSPPPTDRRTRA
jgi:hypothetical protein